jgi:hypothetical protein
MAILRPVQSLGVLQFNGRLRGLFKLARGGGIGYKDMQPKVTLR